MTYSQPFYVGYSPEMRRRFPCVRNGYLPALEPPLSGSNHGSEPGSVPNKTKLPDPDPEIHRLTVLVSDLQNRLNGHIDASKRKKGDSL